MLQWKRSKPGSPVSLGGVLWIVGACVTTIPIAWFGIGASEAEGQPISSKQI